MSYICDYLDKKAYNNRTGHYKFRRQFNFIIENSNNFDKILDVAGGSGRYAIPLHSYSKDITVVDLNETAIGLLRGRDSTIKTICGDFFKTDFQEKFTLITCIEAIENFKDFEEFFNKIATLIADDGRLIYTHINPSSWRYVLRKIRHWKNGPHPYTEMTLSDMKKLLDKCDFEIEHMEGMNWVPLPLTSDSRLVNVFEFIEKVFNLKKWLGQSPWFLISIKKRRIS